MTQATLSSPDSWTLVDNTLSPSAETLSKTEPSSWGVSDNVQMVSSPNLYTPPINGNNIIPGTFENITLSSSGYIKAGQTTYNTGAGFFLGYDNAWKLSIGNGSSNYLTWDGSTLSIGGAVTATSGAIGGFSIGSDYIRDAADSFGLASTVTGSNDVRFWSGNTFANRATAALRIYEDGSIVATNITATGAINATSGWIGSATALVYESQGINTGVTGYIRGGQTSYNTGTGFFLGYDISAYKLSIGNGTTAYLTFNGTALSIGGNINATSLSISGITVLSSATGINQLANQNETITYNANGTVNTITYSATGIVETYSYSGGKLSSWTNGTNTWTLTYGTNNLITNVTVT